MKPSLSKAALPLLVFVPRRVLRTQRKYRLNTPTAQRSRQPWSNYAPNQKHSVGASKNVWFPVTVRWTQSLGAARMPLKQKNAEQGPMPFPADTDVELRFPRRCRGGFLPMDGGCGVQGQHQTCPLAAIYALEFEIETVLGDTPRISGCHVSAYQIRDGKKVFCSIAMMGAAGPRGNWVLKVGGPDHGFRRN